MAPPLRPGAAHVLREDACWLGLFLLGLVGFYAATWARWPLLTADSARELWVPFAVLQGATLYQDFHYLYGPVAPWTLAGLLAAFGERLEVLYVASWLQLAAIGSLLYGVARQLLPPRRSAVVLLLFVSHLALGRDLRGYVWPYAFAATFGVALGLTLLLALLRHRATGRHRWLAAAGLAWGWSLVTKLEYGAAATGLVVLHLALQAWQLRRPPAWRDLLVVATPAALAAGTVAAAVLAQVPLAAVVESVWPTKLMALWDSGGRWAGTPATWRANLGWLALDVVVLLAIAASPLRGGVTPQRHLPGWLGLLLAVGAAGVAASPARLTHFLAEGHRTWLSPSFLLAAAVLGRALTRLWQGEDDAERSHAWTLVSAYTLLVAARTVAHGLNDYTPYQAPVALLLWVALATTWLPRVLGTEAPSRLRLALWAVLLGALIGRHVVDLRAAYGGPHRWVEGPVGGVWNPEAIASPFAATQAELHRLLRPGERFVAGPVEMSFYLMLGQPTPVREAQLFRGYLTTAEEEEAFIRRLAQARVRYVVFSTYGEANLRFGRDYMPRLAAWLRGACRHVATHGGAPYAITIYETPFGWPR
ncbi:MAG: hypothetical protein VKQ33_05865 [Candidatus Sericytochromatia bacterium]|nr:hypothetical protein [Candidatus Sericytochromatia bacterium]